MVLVHRRGDTDRSHRRRSVLLLDNVAGSGCAPAANGRRSADRHPNADANPNPDARAARRSSAHANANAVSVRRPHAHVGAGGNRDRDASCCNANARVAACPALRPLAQVGARLEQPAGGRCAGPKQPRFKGGLGRPGGIAAERGVPASSGVRGAAGDSRVPGGRSPPATRVRPRPKSSHNVERSGCASNVNCWGRR